VRSFSYEPDSNFRLLIVSLRPEEQLRRVNRLRQKMLDQKMLDQNCCSTAEINEKLKLLPRMHLANERQKMWDEMFMIDRYPENRTRFSINMIAIMDIIVGKDSHQRVPPI
jgi:hypothetical protein